MLIDINNPDEIEALLKDQAHLNKMVWEALNLL